MGDTPGDFEWPTGSRYAAWHISQSEPLLHSGSLDSAAPWASVTKVAVALAAARAVERGEMDLDAPLGPPGSSVRHVLAHASGLGLEQGEPTAPVGTRRIYSNVGIDLVATFVANGAADAEWFERDVARPLGLSAVMAGRPSSGAVGSVNDLGRLGRSWLVGPELSDDVRHTFSNCFLPELSGVVPGFGRFSPCPWGLGVEVHGDKSHWMGEKFSPRAFGHFGQSGSLLLIDPDHGIVVAALAAEPFGPWAVRTWPRWMNWLFSELVE